MRCNHMKCKECKEIIPDNKKYCPECGALLNNNIRYDIYNTNNYNPVPQKTVFQTETEYTAPQKAKKSGSEKRVLGIIVIVIAFISVFPTLISLFETADVDNLLFEEVTVYNEYQDRAIEYIQNFYDSNTGHNYYDFNYSTTIDWDWLCSELPIFSGVENTDDAISEYFKIFCQDITDNNNENYVSTEYTITDSYELSEFEIYSYFDILNKKLAPYGLDAADYVDYDGIDNIYEVHLNVTGITETGYSVNTSYQIIVVEYYGFFDVLYDDYFIDSFLSSFITEKEAITI